ncbi:MAG: phage terminase large subunit, partial [Pseudobdellovibrionaceae bacterium]
AYSEIFRKKTMEWFQSTLYTRLEPGGSIIILMTRWHEDDLCGQLLREKNDWQEIRIPAIAEENDLIGRSLNEALCPERYSLEDLLKIKSNVGTQSWNGLYQQRPSAQEGNIFKRSWIQFYDRAPQNCDNLIQSWDLTFKDTKNSDYVVGQVWQQTGANFYLLDQIRARMNFPEVAVAIRVMCAKYPNSYSIMIEDKANGPAIISMLRNEIPGIIPIEPNGSKEARAAAVSSFFESRNVFVPTPEQNPWVNEYVEELCNFPNSKHDDQVDATTQALNRFREHGGIHEIYSVKSREFQNW